MGEQKTVTLAGLKDGAALELWQAALRDVLRNIEDPNTDARVRRMIRLDVTFVPTSEERSIGEVMISCATKLAGVKGARTIIYIGRQRGETIAVEQPRQDEMFKEPGGKLVQHPGGKAGA